MLKIQIPLLIFSAWHVQHQSIDREYDEQGDEEQESEEKLTAEETFSARTMVRLIFEIPDCKLGRGQLLSEIPGGVIRI